MSYQQTINEIRTVATSVNPNGTFDNGGHVDISQNFAGQMPFIYLYPPIIIPAIDPNFIDSSTLILGFWFQDKPESSTLEREEILNKSDILSTLFLNTLIESKYIRVTNPQKDPAFKYYQGCWTGFLLRFNYQNFAPCL